MANQDKDLSRVMKEKNNHMSGRMPGERAGAKLKKGPASGGSKSGNPTKSGKIVGRN